jgi:hypothetical protein
MGVDTRWEEAKEDLVKDSMFFEQDTLVEKILNGLKVRGWSITYPQDWPDLCGNCRGHIEEGTWHSVFNGNFYGQCEVHEGPPRGMVERSWQEVGATEKVMVPYWGDPKVKD